MRRRARPGVGGLAVEGSGAGVEGLGARDGGAGVDGERHT